ncbi:hypothetical protein EDC94DRAFT_593728 [Helicostylum pulchrum]|nr:hypothetical protein EDC94DRAFT_593728 [Helicostylum pulchrum]
MAKDISRPQSKPRKPPQPEFESMDDIKPLARGISTILKRPSSETKSQPDIQHASPINQWTDTVNRDDKINDDKSSQPEINSYSSSNDISSSTYTPHTKDRALDSVGLVKIAPAATRFDDIKSEAMVTWEEGASLKLGCKSDAKKKSKEWLSQSEFFSDEPSSSSPSKNISPDWLPNTERTYAEATQLKKSPDRNTPDWALDEEVQTVPQNVLYGYNQGSWTPTAGAMTHQMRPMMVMSSPYMRAQPSILPASPRDTEYLRYFYVIFDNVSKKKIDKILRRYLSEFSPRTFAIFLKALIPLMEHESSFKQIETHLQVYTELPEDLISLLHVCTLLQRSDPKVSKELPVLEMVRVYESIKWLCTAEESKECIDYLRILKGMPDTSGMSWRDIDEMLPSIPCAEDMVKEVGNKADSLTDYETKKEIRIVNKAHNPWPNVDLLQYTLAHYMMLREELLKPIQNTIDVLFSGKTCQSIEIPNDCAVFEHTMPKSTTMLISSSEAAIVFQLGPSLNHDDMLNSFEEGLFVIVLPESKDTVSLSEHHHVMMNMANDSMIGQAVRASNLTDYRLASVHIHKDDISRMDWSAKYTIITCRINALATLSVLTWLRKEYVDLKKQRFSSVLTPRILAASNTLTNLQLSSWGEENIEQEISINQDCVPFYLLDTEINVFCLMVNNKGNYKAKPAENIWPCHSSQWDNLAPEKRPPLYPISPSQLSSIKFAMNHRIAVISGAYALHAGQFHQPLLVISKTQSSLDTILSQISPSIPDQLERELIKNQEKLNALFLARFQASEHDPAVMCTAIAPNHLKHMQKGYINQFNHSKWAGKDPKTSSFSNSQEDRKEFAYAQWLLESNYLEKAGRGIMPILNANYMQTRFNWIANNPVSILPIADSFNWPFEKSARTGKELRTELANVWERIPTDSAQIIESLANILVTYIDYEIHAAFDDNLTQNRVIGLTADFAAAHRDWVSSLWPRAIIVDEASEILESTLASSILGTRTEHLVLPHLNNTDMSGYPRNLDVSLYERWKGSGKQWRMCSEVANDETTTCNENMVDGSKPQEEIMYGITKPPKQSKQNHVYSEICKLDTTNAEVDEARFNVYFAVYLSQQLCLSQKYLIRAILKEKIPNRTIFTSNINKITIDTVEQNGGRQDYFTIVSTATPANSFSTRDNVSFALTRARYGSFRWKDFASYMKTRCLFDTHMQLSCFEHDFDDMRNGGCSAPCHVCPEVCHFLSHDEMKCLENCNQTRPSKCQHDKNGKCPPCEEMSVFLISVKLICGHETIMECFQSKHRRNLVCHSITRTELPCDPICTEICDQSYECGHPCRECGIEHSHARKECGTTCPKQLICGHGCANGCANSDRHTERYVERCNYMCSHGYKCIRECWKNCTKCVSVCPYSCEHLKCTKKCSEICDRPPCNKNCNIKLDCGHECSGLCGESCPPCSTCHGELKCSISLRVLSEFEEGEKTYVLPECGCVFSVESLDMYFSNQSKNGEHTAVRLWGCPTCQKPIFRAFRYNKFIKTEINLVNTIKLRIEKERQQLPYNEKTEIINAMNNETRQGRHNLVGGRWLVCKNQHPYFVGDCGGATEISKCPECDAPIGGTDHRVAESNRFYGEFDGSDSPAWPGQPENQ